MTPRIFVGDRLSAGVAFDLDPSATRHVQVLRLQPGDALVVFDGFGGEWQARILEMRRSSVSIEVGKPTAVERELPIAVTLAFGMPANDRMDALIEKATELGATALAPLVCERSVLRAFGERADKKVAHWRGVAIAAAEQSGRTRLPRIEPIRAFEAWLAGLGEGGDEARWLLAPSGVPLPAAIRAGAMRPSAFVIVSGPEGGLSAAEHRAAVASGFRGVSLGARVLRADTAPLAALAFLAPSMQDAPAAQGVRSHPDEYDPA